MRIKWPSTDKSLIIFFGLYFLYYIFKFSEYTIDDSYIHFRIARNIAEHGLPYFNIDEKVMGSSPHLWINIIALVFKISGVNLKFMPYFSWLCTMGVFFVTKNLLQSKYTNLQTTILSFCITAIVVLPAAAGLMETPLAILIMLLSILSFKEKNYFMMGLWASISLWLRLEFGVLLALGLIMTPRAYKLSYVKGITIPLLAYVIYTLYYFGTLLPLPMISKPIVFRVYWTEFLYWLPSAVNYKNFFFTLVTSRTKVLAIAGALILLYSFSLVKIRKSESWIKTLFFLSSIILLTYYFKRIFVFSWYAPLFVMPMALTVALTISKRNCVFFVVALLVSFQNIFFIGLTNIWASLPGQEFHFDEFASGRRVKHYLAIGEKLYLKNPQATLLTSEIGALGWSFKGRIYDGAALISPSALKYHPMQAPIDRPWRSAGSIPYQVVEDIKPEFIVSMPIFSITVRREIASGKLPYKITQTDMLFPPEEVSKTGIDNVWTSDRIDVFERF